MAEKAETEELQIQRIYTWDKHFTKKKKKTIWNPIVLLVPDSQHTTFNDLEKKNRK